MTVKLKVVEEPVPTVIAFGELASNGARMFRSAVARAFGSGKRSIALDLTGVRYVDSDGMKEIVGVHRLVRSRGGILGIALKRGALRDLLTKCGLAFQPEVEIFDSLDECAERLRSA